MDKEFQAKILKFLKSSISGIQMEDLAEKLGLICHTVAKYLEILEAQGKIHYIKIDRTKAWKDISFTKNIRVLEMADLDDILKVEKR